MDSAGGFAFAHLATGGHLLRIRGIPYVMQEVRVVTHNGQVDTVQASLRYLACSGY